MPNVSDNAHTVWCLPAHVVRAIITILALTVGMASVHAYAAEPERSQTQGMQDDRQSWGRYVFYARLAPSLLNSPEEIETTLREIRALASVSNHG
jgi:hypothetical protein